jgi:superoxide dismutase, Fe-Mn family
MSFALPPLQYLFNALEPVIDAQTVEIHYTKHHATYLKNLNTAIEKHPQLFEWSLERLISNLDLVPEDIRTAVRNNGGGVYNHNIYWAAMAPAQSGMPVGNLAVSIDKGFQDFSNFKSEFEKTALGRFGSGYCWLSAKKDGQLIIHSTANQDSPLLENLFPLLVVDVWEHAYYLKYQNRRAEYLANWWSLVNWTDAEKRFASVLK